MGKWLERETRRNQARPDRFQLGRHDDNVRVEREDRFDITINGESPDQTPWIVLVQNSNKQREIAAAATGH
jgi:hypothetical protein